MSQRESGWERKERDLYETPAWVTEALLPHLRPLPRIWEPACGSGKMYRVLERIGNVWASDIEPADVDGFHRGDFLSSLWDIKCDADAIITNPPYEMATEFCETALRHMEERRGLVAMLLRTDFDHAKSRSHLFRDCPAFAKKLVLTKRIVWFEAEEGKPKAAPSFNHAWMIWDWQHEGPPTIGYGP